MPACPLEIFEVSGFQEGIWGGGAHLRRRMRRGLLPSVLLGTGKEASAAPVAPREGACRFGCGATGLTDAL